MSAFEENKQSIIQTFQDLEPKQVYEKLIELGSSLEMLSLEERDSAQRVKGCQSQMLIKEEYSGDKLYFKIYSDALISSGIAALLIRLYNGMQPEAILKSDINFLRDLGIISSLSPGRSNGLSSLYLTIKNICLNYL